MINNLVKNHSYTHIRNAVSLKLKAVVLCLLTLFCLSFGVVAQNNQNNSDSSQVEAFFNHIINIHEEITSNPNKQVGNFSGIDSTSLPIGIVKKIGNTIYAICIDSARFTPEGAFFSVYMAMDFPGADRKLAFAAKNIQFNPQGVIVSNGAKLQLISEQTINLGPKLQMIFKNDGKNFIEWDCNGYKQAGISADFVINSSVLINANNPSSPVKASMEMVIADLNNIVFSVPSMSPFKVKGAEDFVFNLSNITIDRSEFTTPSGINLSPASLQVYNNDVNSWKGFYAQSATVTLPQKLSKDSSTMQVYANNLIIDDSGLSGNFGGTNLFSNTEGKMNGSWGFSIASLQVGIECNHLISGSLAGTIIVPPLDDKSFNYSAAITQQAQSDNLDYTFILSLGNEPVSINAFKSSLVLLPSSQLQIASTNNKFIPTARLTGNWTVNFSKAKISGVAFQNLTITGQAPYITSGVFSLTSNQDSSNCSRFPISISNIGMALTPTSQLTFFADIGMSLGGVNVSFGVETSVRVITKLENDTYGKLKIKYDRFAIDDIAIACSTSVFSLEGAIAIKNDDPVFGDLFYGSISLKISGVLENPIMVSVGFGKFPEYKYWFTDASLPLNVTIMTGLKLTSIYGGVQNKVKSTLTSTALLDRVSGKFNGPPSTAVIPFVPDPTIGLTFRAGVGLAATAEKVFNADVLLSVSFNPSGGFQSIDFLGRAFLMVKRNERQNNSVSKVEGEITVSYDNVAKILDAQITASIIVPSILQGGLSVKFHIDKNDWYFWLNRPTNRAQINLLNIFTVQTYFMIGTQIEAIPPPPSYVANVVGYSGGSIDLAAAGNGSGFCTGLQIGVNFNGEFPKNTEWRGYVSLAVGGGFDVMVFNSENTRCSGSNDKIGVNGYYAVGQVYVYLNGSLGARKYKNGELKNEYSLGSLQVAALLMGKLPKPSFIYGAVGIQCQVLGIINFGFNADIEFGNDCNFVTI